jgi:hypothetical protein
MDLGSWLSVAGAAGGWAAAFSVAWINIRAFLNGTLPTPREAKAMSETIAKQDKQIGDLTKQNHQVVYEVLPAINSLLDAIRTEAAKKP